MHNLLENSSNYYDTSGSLCFYSKDEATSFKADIVNTNANFNADIANTDNYKYKTKLIGSTAEKGILKNITIPSPMKYRGNFGRSLEITLINCKVKLKC